MLFTANEFFDYTIRAQDGEIGSVHDILFDDEVWKLRYFVVDTGGWLFGRKVLVPPYAVLEPDRVAKALPVELTKEQVKDSPDVAVDPPLTREQEIVYHDYYRWPYYWGGGSIEGAAMTGVAPEAMLVGDTRVTPDAHPLPPEDRDPSLRSAKNVIGYEVRNEDQLIGELVDMVVEAAVGHQWMLPYGLMRLEVSGERKTILVPVEQLEITWPEEVVAIKLSATELASCPVVPDEGPYDMRTLDLARSHYGTSPRDQLSRAEEKDFRAPSS
jgi:hypothetical protein